MQVTGDMRKEVVDLHIINRYLQLLMVGTPLA